MKRIVIVAAFVALIFPPATAQEDERRLSFSGEVGIGVPFNTPKTMSVLLRASAYYNAGCRSEGGLLLSPAVGVKWKLRPRLKAHLAVGYELQKLTRLKSYSDPYFDYGFREELSHSSLTIRAGITF